MPRQLFDMIGGSDKHRLPPDIEDAYPLTSAQREMLFQQRDSQELLYQNVYSYHLRGQWDKSRFDAAVQSVISRYAVLRTSFNLQDYDQPLQLVHRQVQPVIQEEDLCCQSPEQQQKSIDEFVFGQRCWRTNLCTAPQLHFQIHHRNADTFQFTLIQNCAILDEWSLRAVLAEIVETYFSPDRASTVLPRTTYRDFVAEEIQESASVTTMRFWQQKLDDCTIFELPTLKVSTVGPVSGSHAVKEVEIAPSISADLNKLAESLGLPLKSILLAAHIKIMSVISGSSDVITGMMISAWPEGVRREVRGFCLNMVAVRHRVVSCSWIDLIRGVFQTESELLPFSRFPFALVQRSFGKPLFNVVFNFTDFDVEESFHRPGELAILGSSKYGATGSDFVVSFRFNRLVNRLELELEYKLPDISIEQVNAWSQYYSRSLQLMADAPSWRHDTVCLLTEAERRQVLREWNQTETEYADQKCVHELFEEQVERTPNAVAVQCGKQVLTFAALNCRANQLAHYLLEKGVQAEQIVGICLGRRAEMIVTVLGVFKAGGAYTWLDPSYPAERLNYILDHAHIQVLLTAGAASSAVLTAAQAEKIDLDNWDLICRKSHRNLPNVCCPDNLAYVAYTSGSTGQPKGVAVIHRALSNLRTAQQAKLQLPPGTVVSQLLSFSFDAAVWEWMPLLWGAKLMVAESLLSGDDIKDFLERNEVELAGLTPSMLGTISQGGLVKLKTLVVGAEPCPAGLVTTWGTGRRFFNGYGPTETTVIATLSQDLKTGGSPPIGSPLANIHVYILDEQMNLLPAGTSGELCIGGLGVARGYWKQPAQTAEQFVPDPFAADGSRLYRTGDLVRWRTDGALDFIGRLDQQVKIRGFRIELGEIESALTSHQSVQEAVVVVKQDAVGEKRIVGYVVPKAGTPELSLGELKQTLRARLPEYMIPAVVVELDQMPQTPSGKLDRRALPEPPPQGCQDYVAPQTATEKVLAKIWKDVLGVELVGRDDDFFELGGDSLSAARAVSRTREVLGIELPLKMFFLEVSTLRKLARLIEERSRTSQQRI